MISTLAIQNLTDSTLVRGFVTADCGRGTIDILWSCLTAIFLSIWTVIHLPVPCFDIERPDNFRRKVVGSRIGTSLLALLAPEFMLWVALGEFITAYSAKKKLQELSIDANLTHGFFLATGGFCLIAPGGKRHQLRLEDVENAITASKTAAEARDTATATDAVTETEDVKVAIDTAVEIKDLLLHSKEWVRELKLVEESDIKNLAKSASIEKLLASFQGFWVLTQAISRIYQHKALSLLEVTTSAYICCAVGIYAFWWKMPQNCSVPIMITCSDEAIRELSPSAYTNFMDWWFEFLWAGRDWSSEKIDTYSFSTSTRYCIYGLFVLSLMTFGSVHLASWNSTLPSTIELWMWRGSSLICVIYSGLFAFGSVWEDLHDLGALSDALDSLVSYGVVFYIIARIYMIVEVFISLRALPVSAFQSVQWSSFIPHI